MAIGDTFENGAEQNGTSNSKRSEYSYYPRLKVRKDKAETQLNFEYRSGLLQFKIVKLNPDGFTWDNEHPLGIIYLSPTKATLLANEIKAFKQYLATESKIDPKRAFGVNGGMGEKVSFIAFHADKDKNISIDIGKFDGNGVITESVTTELNRDYHYSLEWNDLSSMDVTRVFDNTIELNQIQAMLEDFGRFMNGAAAYAQADLTRYDLGRVLGKMDPIYDKLGIERLNKGGSGFKPRQSNNFLNNSGKSESKSYESIQEMFDD